jgi:hypothetical protein
MNELGLKNTFREKVYEPLQAYRGSTASPGREITLEAFMNDRLKMTNTENQAITIEDLFVEAGIDPVTSTLDNVLTTQTDMKYLAPELVRDMIYAGYSAEPFYLDLCMSSENVDSMNVVTPWLKYTDARPTDTSEAETISESTLTYGDKMVKLGKKAIGVTYSDELLLSVRIPMLRPYLERVGYELAYVMNTLAVSTLVNGDQNDASDACAYIGTQTSGTLAYVDFTRCWVRGRSLAKKYNYLVTSEAGANTVLNITEFSYKQNVGTIATSLDSRNIIVPANLGHQISSAVGDSEFVLVDPRGAMVHLTFMPLRVEADRIVSKQISGSYVSVIEGFTTVDRASRIMIDKSKAFSGYGFPGWMAPLV